MQIEYTVMERFIQRPMCLTVFSTPMHLSDQLCSLYYSHSYQRETKTHTSDSSIFSKRYAGVSLDFECALRNAVVETFPTAELKGCLFHYCKAIWKKTQEYGHQRDYKDLQEVNILVRRAAALPLLPLNKVEDYWLHTLENAPDRKDCTKLTDNVTET